MKNAYNAMFEKLSPQKSDSELLRAVLDRKAEKTMRKKFNKKALLIPAIALGALCITTVGVSAAVNWDLPSAIGTLFQKPAESVEGGMSFSDFAFNNLGSRELTERFERDGYTVQMVGVVADEYTSFMLYDIILEDEDAFKNEQGEFVFNDDDEPFLAIWEDFFNHDYEPLIGRYFQRRAYGVGDLHTDSTAVYLGRDGNVFHCACRYDVMPMSLKGEKLIFEVLGLHMGKFDDDVSSDKFTINYDFVNDSEFFSVDGNAPFTFDGEAYFIDRAEITPFSLDLQIVWEKEKENEQSTEDILHELCKYSEKIRKAVKVKFKNGSMSDNEILYWDKHMGVPAMAQGGVFSAEMHLMWKYPVDINDIEAIIIGDGEFKIN